MTTDASAKLSPQEFIDQSPMSRRQRLIVVLGLLMMIAEGLDAAVAAFVYPRIEDDWGTDTSTVTITVTMSVLAMIVGGVVAGPLADRHGRKVVTVTGITVFGLGTAAMALSQEIVAFTGLRIVACLGLGAVLPTVMALVADWTPVGRRVQMVALAFTGVTAGTAVGGLLASVLIPAFGWPTLLAVCGIAPLLLIPAVLRFVPESVSVLAARGRTAQLREVLTEVAPGRDLSGVALEQTVLRRQPRPPARVILSRDFAPTTLLLWLCFFVGQGVVFVILSYLPLLAERTGTGLTGSQAAVAIAVFGWGGLMGQLAVSFALKRLDRLRALLGLWGLALVSFAAAGLWAERFPTLLAGAFVLGLCLPAANAALQATAAVAYPPSARATGMSWANSAGKLGPVAGGLLGGLMANAGWSLSTVLLTLTVPVGLGIVATLTLNARRSGPPPVPQPAPRPLPAPASEQV
ncbi:MFS transporter [Streptomyces sp. NPDC127072]|uniref:MFS transporter n=1 Tax=Streptomyces sp. NPDC127072 TaxID=3347129 RepID=UPI00366158AB